LINTTVIVYGCWAAICNCVTHGEDDAHHAAT